MTYYTTQEFSNLIRRPSETARYWRSIGQGPRWFKVGRKVLYDAADVHAWIDQLKSDSGPTARPAA